MTEFRTDEDHRELVDNVTASPKHSLFLLQGGKSSLSPFPCLTYRIEDPKSISRANALTFISLYLERAADHITNIGKDLIYMVTGEIRDLNH